MSWIREIKTSWIHSMCCSILKTGAIPKHVAFIMDGNRRFARKCNIEKSQGHYKGFEKLAETLEWCLDLGITEVTVYAFSIENFKRSKEEVDGLMELARDKFKHLLQEKEMIQKHEVCVRVLGNIELLPLDVGQCIAEAMEFSKKNKRAVLNVCFAYTSRDEICAAMKEVTEGVQSGIIRTSDISENLLSQCLYTNKSDDPDLLVRTSGEVRLSDFLLWQSSYSCLSFMKVLWPEFTRWHLYAGVLHYQLNHEAVQNAKLAHQADNDRLVQESDYNCVAEEIQNEKGNGSCRDHLSIQQRLEKYTVDREKRIKTFIDHVRDKREQYIRRLCNHKKSLNDELLT